MWTQADFNLSCRAEAALFGDRGRHERAFRKLLAALDSRHAIGLPPSFFGYAADGKPDPAGYTAIGMGRTKNGLRILATGAAASQVLQDRIGAIHAALMITAETIIPLNMRSGAHEANFLPFERGCYIHNLAVGKISSTCFWSQIAEKVKAGSTWEAEASRAIQRSVGDGLFQQARMLLEQGDDVHGNVEPMFSPLIEGEATFLSTIKAFQERLCVRLHKVHGHTYAKVGDGGAARLVLKGVEVTMKGHFTGAWSIGRLKIEARGQLLEAQRVWQTQELAA